MALEVQVLPSISFIDVSFIFIIFFRGFGLVLAVTGKWFSLLCFFQSSVRFRASPLMTTKKLKKESFQIDY